MLPRLLPSRALARLTTTTTTTPSSLTSGGRRALHRHAASATTAMSLRRAVISSPGAPQIPRPLAYIYAQISRRDSSSTSSSSAAASPADQLDGVIVTNACIKRIKALQGKSGKEGLKLRLSVEGGGCSGFQYTFTMDADPLNEDDKVFERDGAQVVVDESSLEFVRGATVDFTDDMMRSAFAVVNNPLSESACGCGSSFAVKNFGKNPAID